MRSTITLFVIFIFSLPFITFAQDETAVASLEPYAELVEILPAGEEEWQPVIEPVLVNEGDQIRTDAGGWALLTYFEGVSTEILPDTEILVGTLDLPTEDSSAFNVNITVIAGDTFNAVNTVLDDDSSFEVQTSGATASVRGTRFYVGRSPVTGRIIIIVREGKVAVTDEDNPNAEPFLVEEGFSTEFNAGDDTYTSNPIDNANIPDRPEATCNPEEQDWCDVNESTFFELLFVFECDSDATTCQEFIQTIENLECDPFEDDACFLSLMENIPPPCDPAVDEACADMTQMLPYDEFYEGDGSDQWWFDDSGGDQSGSDGTGGDDGGGSDGEGTGGDDQSGSDGTGGDDGGGSDGSGTGGDAGGGGGEEPPPDGGGGDTGEGGGGEEPPPDGGGGGEEPPPDGGGGGEEPPPDGGGGGEEPPPDGGGGETGGGSGGG